MSANRRDKRRERYSRNTEGWNAQGFFSPDPEIAYGTSASLQDLIYTGAPGEIGLFIDGLSTAIAPTVAGTRMVIAQKNSDDTIKKSTELIYGQYSTYKTVYDAPVKQKDLVFPLNINIVGGLQEFVLSARETTPANQPFPIQEGRAIVRSGNPSEIDIAMAIVADINNTYDFEKNGDNKFVAVNVVTDAVGVAAAAGTYIFTDGSSQVFVSGADVTAEAVPGAYLINTEVVTGSTFLVLKVVSSSYDAVTGNSTIETYPSYSGAGAGVETTAFGLITYADQATIDAANVGITLLGTDELTHFDTSVSEDLGDAVVATITDWNFGSGAAWQVASIEDECAVFDGWTTVNEAWVRDFGAPDLWVDDSSATEYNLFFIDSLNRIIPSAGAPQNQTLMEAHIVIAAVNLGTLDVALDAILEIP